MSHRYILIRYPSVRSLWTTAHDCWFQTVNYNGVDEEWIRLFLSPVGGWVAKNTYIDSDPEIRHSSNGTLLTVTRHRQTFEGNVEGCHAIIYGMVKELIDPSIDSNDSDALTPITIYDYASPVNVSTLRTAINSNTDTGVLRTGIMSINEVGSMVGNGSSLWLPGGFKFTFEELQLYV